MKKPTASLSLDLDNKWAYLKNYGDAHWKYFPSYYAVFVPHVLNLLKELNLKCTFFLVGKDLEIADHHQYVKMIVKNGHEIGNHSFHHDTWLHLYTDEQLRKEIERSHKVIAEVSGRVPVGFRGPGFTHSNKMLELLSEKGYLYDSSSFPTFIGPLLRWYYMKNSVLSAEQKKARKTLFGSFKDGFKKLKPYFFKLENGDRLLEVPVTTMPFFRLPIHMTYLIYLGKFSPRLMMFYLTTAIYCCKWTKTRPCFLIHPTDLMGSDLVRDLDFFPGMQLTTEKKVELFTMVINRFKKHYSFETLMDYVNEILTDKPLKHVALPTSSR